MSGEGNPLPFHLLAITGPERETPDPAVHRAVEAAGSRVAILLRDATLGADGLCRWAERLLPVCRAAGARLLVHGDPAVAREVGADGVHLPEGGPAVAAARAHLGRGLIGVSRHDAAGLRGAIGADYATLSPVWKTPGKGEPLGVERFAALGRAAPRPIVALGGVTPERAAVCRAAGAAAVAAVRAVWAGDPGENVRRLLAGWDDDLRLSAPPRA